MAFFIEHLERRDLLTNLDLDFDGPRIVNAGDEVTYTLSVTNVNQFAVEIRPDFQEVQLDGMDWTLDGQPSGDVSVPVRLSPNQTVAFEATGRVPDGRGYFFAFMYVSWHGGNTAGAAASVYVLNQYSDVHTIGSAIHTRDGALGTKVLHSSVFPTAIHEADVDQDGLNDITVEFRPLDGEDGVIRWYRFTLPGKDFADRPQDFFSVRVGGAVELESPSPTNLNWDRNAPVEQIEIGDVDNDGYDDVVRADPLNDTATIFFGPDHRENFVIFGRPQIGQPDGDPWFGLSAGPLGDVNGDGFADFYVLDRYSINVFYGRDYDRNPTGDVNRDGLVDFDDFLVLAENFDHETNDRALGELDGDGRVTFRDFLLLAENFGKSK